MALAIDASTPAYVSTGISSTNVATLTTASFTPPNGALLAVLFSQDNGAVTVTQQKPSNTGGAVTWDAAVKVQQASNSVVNSVWLGTVTTSAAMTVTQTIGTAEIDWGFGVVVVTGQAATQNGATQTGGSNSGTPTATIASLVGANSLVVASLCNFTNLTVGTPGTGQSISFNGNSFSDSDNAHSGSFWSQYLTGINLAAGVSATINDTAPTAINYGIAMLEILAATGAAASIPDLIMAPAHR